MPISEYLQDIFRNYKILIRNFADKIFRKGIDKFWAERYHSNVVSES